MNNMKKPMSAFFLLLAECAAAQAETAPLRDDFMMAPIVFRRSQIPPAEQQHYQVQVLSEPAEPILDEPPLWVSDRVLLDHRDIQSAEADWDALRMPAIDITLTRGSAQKLYQITRQYRGGRLVLVDGESHTVISAPYVYEPISGGRVQVGGTGSFAENPMLARQIAEHGEFRAGSDRPRAGFTLMPAYHRKPPAAQGFTVWRQAACTFTAQDFSHIERADASDNAEETVLRLPLNARGRQKYQSPVCLDTESGVMAVLHGRPAELGNVNVKEDGQAFYLFGAIGKDMNDYWNILTRQD